MNEEKIREMLAKIIEHVDYDIYKDIFVNPEDSEEAEELIEELIQVVKKYV